MTSQVDHAELILDTGLVGVNSRDNLGFTPLSWAAVLGDKSMAQRLLDTEQVNLESEDKFGQTALS
jgi:ankyrin repeat protein